MSAVPPKADIGQLHSITSLARADMAGDTSRPRVLAVFQDDLRTALPARSANRLVSAP
jgi:hypothetical protein